jgi:hypothetical protein
MFHLAGEAETCYQLLSWEKKMRSRILCLVGLFLTIALSLSAHAQSGSLTTLWSFTGGIDGDTPKEGLVFDASGNLYGASFFGSTVNDTYCQTGCGAVFQLKPAQGGAWAFATLYSFAGGTDFGHPNGRLAVDQSGNVWGTANEWGPGGFGGVFELSAANNWSESLIWSSYSGMGEQPAAGLTAHNGSWYGTTQFGRGYVDNGQVFSLTPGSNGQWNENVVHEFAAGSDGYEPQTELIFDQAGNIYGSTPYGGSCGCGDIFELSPVSGGLWKEKIIYQFPFFILGGSDYPSTLLLSNGVLYGTAGSGGSASCGDYLGCGFVFELKRTGNTWQETTLYEFGGGSDGKGNLYGGTLYGGTGACVPYLGSGCGTIYKLSQSDGVWQKTTLYSFTGETDGEYPHGALVLDSAGDLFGITEGGYGANGTYTNGTVFEFLQ